MEVEHLDLGYGDEEPINSKRQRLLVEFFKDAKLNAVKTEANRRSDGGPGAEIYDSKIFVRVTHPGRLQSDVFEASDKYKKQFPREWKRFLTEDSGEHGTPISKIVSIGKDMLETLRSQKVMFVEQLAALSDDDLSGLGIGARDAREKAKIFLGQANEVELLKQRIKELESKVDVKNSPSNSSKRDSISRI